MRCRASGQVFDEPEPKKTRRTDPPELPNRLLVCLPHPMTLLPYLFCWAVGHIGVNIEKRLPPCSLSPLRSTLALPLWPETASGGLEAG